MQEPQPGEQIPSGEPFEPAPQTYTQQGYSPVSYTAGGPHSSTPYPPPGAPIPADQGLSDTAGGALAYVTIIPAILFLVLAPYNARPFVRFHAFQCLGLAAAWVIVSIIGVIPVLGWLIWALGSLALLAVWVISIVKASQGSYLILPVVSEFASKQSGFPIA